MIKVSIEVRSGTARFDVAVQAESIQRALSLVTRRHSGSTCRVKFPIEAERFFVTGPAIQEGLVEPPQKMAA
jgi:hypothetical protein